MAKFFKTLCSTKTLLFIAFLINVAFFVLLTLFVNSYIYTVVSAVIALIVLAIVLNSHDNSHYKITWILVIFLLPIFGCSLYLTVKFNRASKSKRKLWNDIYFENAPYIPQNLELLNDLKKIGTTQYKQSLYINNTINWPVYQNTGLKYLASGEEYYKELFHEIKNAKQYIFLEYFIFENGRVWKELFELLKDRARTGVDIKILYDDFGCIDRFEDKDIFKKLANYKIEACPFNKVVPTINAFVNYRTHRKIAVIDGKIAFTGGINIGDEYCNYVNTFGHWKDSGIKLSGEGAWSFSVMFLNSWQFASKQKISVPDFKPKEPLKVRSKDFVQPYGTSPINREACAKNIYLNMINNAQNNIYIITPYFIIDDETTNALKLAVKSGVNVTIIVPGIPDKKLPFYLARSRFAELIRAGVKINEYSPGFIHSKIMLVDGVSAIIGTTNFDFRSLYLHFENGVLIHNSDIIKNIEKDIQEVLNLSHLDTLKDMKKRKFREKFMAEIIRFFEPLM